VSLLLSIPLSHRLYEIIENAGSSAALILHQVWDKSSHGSLCVLIFFFGTLVLANTLVFQARGGLRSI